MKCPFCSASDTKVSDSRLTGDGYGIRRRRFCEICRRRFTTYEWVQETIPVVKKKDGRREPFDRQKLLKGLTLACQKRPISQESLAEIALGIERTLIDRGDPEVDGREIGERVMEALEKLDRVAYVRFASVYRNFQDPHQFLEELKRLLDTDSPPPPP
ncbi:MAG: transcriptional regulator NrdR [Leptospirales bacterium]